MLVDKKDPTGKDRRRAQDRDKALAGKSTLNRMELGAEQKPEKERYKKRVRDSGERARERLRRGRRGR